MSDTSRKSSWTARAVARHIDVAPSTISSWISSGLIEPARRGRGRRGHDLGVTGLLEALAVRDLLNAGFAPYEIRRVISLLRELTDRAHPLTQVCLIVLGDDILIQNGNDEEGLVSVLRHPAQRVMLFRIGREHAKLAQALDLEDVATP